MSSISLAPCPFCGSDAIDIREYGNRHWAVCDDCGGRNWGFTPEAAALAWNTRALTKATDTESGR